MKLGNKLRNLRLQNNLTMQELADRSNLSKGFISQLENNVASPSVDTLTSILDVLGVSFSKFFAETEVLDKFVFKNTDIVELNEENYIIKWLVPNAHNFDLEPIIITLKPFSKSQEIAPFQGQAFGYVLKGSITLYYGNRTNKLLEGESFYLNGNANHYLENNISKNSEVMWISTPPIF